MGDRRPSLPNALNKFTVSPRSNLKYNPDGSLIREESPKGMGGEITDLGMQGLNIDLHGHSLAEIL